MAIKDDIVNFLKTDTAIGKVNFKFGKYLIYPKGYSGDVARLVSQGNIGIKVTTAMNPGAGASYYMGYNEFWVPPSFKISDDKDCSLLVHEATHALMDYQRLGMMTVGVSEARSLKPISQDFVRVKAHSLAKRMLASGRYEVEPGIVNQMTESAGEEPHYKAKSTFVNYDGI